MALVSIEQAVSNALATRLRARLEDVDVSARWLDPERPLFVDPYTAAITVLPAGKRRDTLLDAEAAGYENVHDALPARITAPVAVDLATAVARLNEAKARWNTSAASLTEHLVADVTSVITGADCFDLGTAVFLANSIRPIVAPHVLSEDYHTVADTGSALSFPDAFDLGSLVALANDIADVMSRHFATRLYHWRIRMCEQPVQLDVWAKYAATRDDVMARLESELNSDATALQLDCGAPARNGILIDVADGWEGAVADILFDAPEREDSAMSKATGTYRATYSGRADFALTVKQFAPRLSRVRFNVSAYQQTLAGTVAETTTVT